ncbi:Mediator of DNA damage checkpoint protein 1 [Geodia barretti]|uniref:PAX-interacting protein 1 n=1 Tax=Geodia barretti TaxID=519541 RepID=A0AA35WIR5_GEOBA|nr:Mediator of DNA damage checkpoint protein 1 [Geodia barretti]
MGDIITCSGGEVLTTLPQPPGVGVIIVASPDDLSMLSTAVEAGMAIHSTELILGGVLRQELDLTAHQLSVGGASSSGPAPSSSAAGGTWWREEKEKDYRRS